MAPRLAPAAVSISVLALATGEASATITEYTDQTAYSAATSDSTTFTFDGLVPPGTAGLVGNNALAIGDLSFAGGNSSDFPVVFGSGFAVYGGSSFLSTLSGTPGVDPTEVVCTLSGSTAIGFTYGDYNDSGGLPFTVTLSTGDSFGLNTPPNPGFDTGFVGFVSDTPITSVTFSDDGQGFDLIQVEKSSAGAVGAPEPAPFALMATGLLCLVVLTRRRRTMKVERVLRVLQLGAHAKRR